VKLLRSAVCLPALLETRVLRLFAGVVPLHEQRSSLNRKAENDPARRFSGLALPQLEQTFTLFFADDFFEATEFDFDALLSHW